MLETEATATLAANSKIPRSERYANGASNEYVENLAYPNTGNGMPASLDGRLLPEFTIAPTAMRAGNGASGQPATVMRLRFDDGTPYPHTVGGVTASDWHLIPDAASPTGFAWTPLP